MMDRRWSCTANYCFVDTHYKIGGMEPLSPFSGPGDGLWQPTILLDRATHTRVSGPGSPTRNIFSSRRQDPIDLDG